MKARPRPSSSYPWWRTRGGIRPRRTKAPTANSNRFRWQYYRKMSATASFKRLEGGNFQAEKKIKTGEAINHQWREPMNNSLILQGKHAVVFGAGGGPAFVVN